MVSLPGREEEFEDPDADAFAAAFFGADPGSPNKPGTSRVYLRVRRRFL